ncbi:hypothetical protein D3C78_1668950 [compost metagenome]
MDALLCKSMRHIQAILRHRQLDHDIRRPFRHFEGFLEHAVSICANDLGADRARYDTADFLNNFLKIAAFLRN